MRRVVLLVVLLAVPLAQAGLSLQQNGVDLGIEHRLIGPEGSPADHLEPGTGGRIEVTVTNRENRTVNVTFQLRQGNRSISPARQTGPVAPNGTNATFLPVAVSADAPEGPRNLTLFGVVAVEEDGNWSRVENLTRNVTIQIVAPAPPPRPFPVVPALLVVAAVGLGGAAVYLRLHEPSRELPPEPTEEEVQRGIQERQQSIVEAKRQDIEESIERARDRLDRGEITEYQFERIKERKESELEELDDDGDT